MDNPVLARDKSKIVVLGEGLRQWRERKLRATQRSLAERAGLSEPLIRSIEGASERRVSSMTFWKLVKALGVSEDEAIGLLSKQGVVRFELDENTVPASERPIRAPIPTFELAIHATHWTDPTDNIEMGEVVTAAQRVQGRFRVRVTGDCMAPKYPDGCLVEFRLLDSELGRPDIDACVPGKNYYVQLDDGRATFKQLVEIRCDTMILRPLSRKYRKTLGAPIENIQRLGVALGQFVPD